MDDCATGRLLIHFARLLGSQAFGRACRRHAASQVNLARSRGLEMELGPSAARQHLEAELISSARQMQANINTLRLASIARARMLAPIYV